MARFAKLTNLAVEDKKDVFVNIDKIFYIHPNSPKGSVIQSEDCTLKVEEEIKEVFNALMKPVYTGL